MRSLLILLIALSLSACGLVYKLPTRQGNVIDQKQLDQLQLGMTQDQVKFLMGTAVATGPFTANRWDYIGYYKSPRGDVSERTVTLYFADNKLSKMDGIKATEQDTGLQAPSAKTVIDQQKKEKLEDSRAANEGDIKASTPSNVPTNQAP